MLPERLCMLMLDVIRGEIDMVNISFNVKEVRYYLLENKMVYTLRPKKNDGSNLAVMVGNRFDETNKPKKIGNCKSKFITEITNPNQLNRYVRQSGFRSIEDWLAEAKGSRFLHLVELKKENEYGKTQKMER